MIDSSSPPATLSPVALAALQRLRLSPVADGTAPREVLEAQLAAAGWPCSEAVLLAEETAGGLGHPPSGVFGVYASLRYLRGEEPWQRDDLQDYGLYPDPRAPGQKLLPLWILGHPRCWLSLDGSVFLGDHIDRPNYVTRSFEDVAHYWEVLLLLDGFIVALMRPLYMPRFRLEASALAGEAIARDLGLKPFGPGSRGATLAWTGDGVNAVQLALGGFKTGTDVVSDTAEGIILAAAKALDVGDSAIITSHEEIPEALIRELPVPTKHEHLVSHMYKWGKPLDYSEERYRRRYREKLGLT